MPKNKLAARQKTIFQLRRVSLHKLSIKLLQSQIYMIKIKKKIPTISATLDSTIIIFKLTSLTKIFFRRKKQLNIFCDPHKISKYSQK